ncbi:MAG: HAD family hydrolase [Planctomycetota bacterium]|jgi:phosphoglycolate phosphatase
MQFSAVLFDLDGTLLDTLADIGHSANQVLQQRRYPPHPVEAYRRYVGDGVTVLFQRVLPATERRDEVIAECVADFREVYGRNWNIQTQPYEGVPDLLDAVCARGLTMAVLSNKPDAFTRQCVDEYLAAWPFAVVLGQREGIPCKPDPAGAKEIVARVGIAAERFLYLGDTPTDVKTAQSANMYAAGVSWGFRPVEELRAAGAAVVVERPGDLINVLDGPPG